MAIRLNLFSNPFVREHPTYDDVNDTFDELVKYYPKFWIDTTGGSITGSGTETTIATVTIPAGSLGSSAALKITASVKQSGGSGSGTTNGTYRLKIAGVTKETLELITLDTSVISPAGILQHYETGVDNTGSVTVIITGQLGTNTSNIAYCESLIVEGFEKVRT
jgi:hypothetical protein